jgi:hypothetical protein
MYEINQSSRPNNEMSKLVEQGLALLQTHDRALASAFLVRRGIPFSVIVRVLSDPPERRRTARARSLERPEWKA